MNYTLITGASSGIGYEFARLFAENNHNLILISRNIERLEEAAHNLKTEFRADVQIIAIDLSKSGSAAKLMNQISAKSLKINYLINNAGFYVKGAFSETSWEAEQGLIELQCINHIHLTKLILPGLLDKGKGGILHVTSTGSFVPGPFNAIYCAAKSFVLSFSEALAVELAGSGIHVTALCPGGTLTNFQDFNKRKKSLLFPVMGASEVARAGYYALMKNKALAIPGFANKLQVFAMRFLSRKTVSKLAGSAIAP